MDKSVIMEARAVEYVSSVQYYLSIPYYANRRAKRFASDELDLFLLALVTDLAVFGSTPSVN